MLRDACDWICGALEWPVSTSFQQCCCLNSSLSCSSKSHESTHKIKNEELSVPRQRGSSSPAVSDDFTSYTSTASLFRSSAKKHKEVHLKTSAFFTSRHHGKFGTFRYGESNFPCFVFILLLMVSCSGYSSQVEAGHCEKGVKYFDKDTATCVPCSECKRPLYTIIPCYEFMDTVCDNPAEYLSEQNGILGISNAGNDDANQPDLSRDNNSSPNQPRQNSGRASSESGRRGRRKNKGRKKKRRKNGKRRKNKDGTEQSGGRISTASSNSNTNSMYDDYSGRTGDPVFQNHPDYDMNFYEYPDYLEYWDSLRAEYEQNSRSATNFPSSRKGPNVGTIYDSESRDDISSAPSTDVYVRPQVTARENLNKTHTGNFSATLHTNSTSSIITNGTTNNPDGRDANTVPASKGEVDSMPARPRFEVGKLWRNGWTTAIVLALVIVVGLMAVALIIVLGMQVFIYSKNRIVDRMKDKNDYQDGGGFSTAVLLHQPPASPIITTADQHLHHLQHKLKDSEEKDNDVVIGGGTLPMSRPKARKFSFTLGRGSKEKIFHVARTYKPAPCRSKLDSSSDLPPQQEQLMTLAPNSVLTPTSAFSDCSGTTYCSREWLDPNCIPHTFEGGSKETTFTSLSSANNSPPLSPLSDGPAPQTFAPKPPVRLTKSQEEKILRSSNTSTNCTPIVDCVLTSNIVTFDDGSTLSTTTNYTTNPTPNSDRVLTPAYPYSQTLPTTYVRTSRTVASDHTVSPPSGSVQVGAEVGPSFPAILESKGSPIPYTMDRLLEQRRRLGCASSVDTNIYVEMWRGSSAAPSNNPSAVPSPALQHRTTTSTTSVPSSSSSSHPAGEDGAGGGDSFAALERNLATLSRGIESLHASTRGSSPSGTSGGSPSLRRGGGGSSNNSSICSSRLAHRLTAHLNSVAAANTVQGSPKLALRHFK